MNRRTFLKSSCSACLLAGAGLAVGTLSSCSTVPVYATSIRENTIAVPARLFADRPLQLVSVEGFEYEIAVERRGNGYRAFLLRCTHADNALTYTGSRFVCTLHGSTFDEEGRVTKGPATMPLESLRAVRVGEAVIVQMNP